MKKHNGNMFCLFYSIFYIKIIQCFQAVSFLMKHLAIKFSYKISHDLFKLKIISRNTFIQYLLITV